MKQNAAIYERGKRNCSAYAHNHPGCVATAKSRCPVEKIICEAITFYIGSMRLHGAVVPEPTIEAGTIAIPV